MQHGCVYKVHVPVLAGEEDSVFVDELCAHAEAALVPPPAIDGKRTCVLHDNAQGLGSERDCPSTFSCSPLVFLPRLFTLAL